MSVKLDRTMYRLGSGGRLHIAVGRPLYVLETNGALDRVIDPNDVAATETLVEGFHDEALTSSAGTGPFTSNADGQFDVWFPAGSYDLYAPTDTTNPITRWQTVVASADLTALEADVATLESNRALKANLEVNAGDYTSSFTPFATPIDKAISVLGAFGGTVRIPRGTHTRSSQWDLEGATNIEFVGESSIRDIAGGTSTVINFTGNPGVGNGQLNIKGAKGLTFRNLVFLNSHATFAGYVIDGQNSGATGATDTNKITFDHCSIFGGASRNPAAGIYGRNTHTFVFKACSFYDCQVGVLGRTLNAEYAINWSFDEGCFFQNNVVAHVKNAGCGIASYGGAGWKFSNTVFEPLVGNIAGAYKHDTGVKAHALSFDNCWFGDNVSGTGALIYFSGYCLNVTNCRLGSEAAGARIIIIDENGAENINVIGNYCVGDPGTPIPCVIDFGSTTGHGAILAANYKEGVTTEFGGVAIPTTAIEFGKFGMVFGGTATLYAGGGDTLETGSTFRIGADAFLLGSAVGAGAQFIEGWEQSADPAAPAANAGRLFFKDNGAGKTQLCVRFSSGATQVIATQP